MRNNAEMNKDLEILLELSLRPAGVRFLYTPEQYAAAESPEFKKGMAYCNMVRLAGLGKSFKAASQHSSCGGGSVAMGLTPINTYRSSGNSYNKDNLWLYDTIGTARKVVEEMPFMEVAVYGLEVRPLSLYANYNPDVVIIIDNPYNMMRLVQGYAFHYGMKPDVRLSGNQALCSELTVNPFMNNDINLSMLCSGTRHRCNWGDNAMGIGIAYSKLPSILSGLFHTMPDTEPKDKKLAIAERAKAAGETIETQIGREYFSRPLKRTW